TGCNTRLGLAAADPRRALPATVIRLILRSPAKFVRTRMVTSNEGEEMKMNRTSIPPIVAIVALLAASGGVALAAQDKYALQVPGGLAFSEFRGYGDWQTIAVSQNGMMIETILGNPAMIEAYKAGIPGNGRPFPDGAKMAKIHWNAKKNVEEPG